MDHIKEAFQKIKQDIESLNIGLNYIKKDLFKTKESLIELCQIIEQLSKKRETTQSLENSTNQHTKPTEIIPIKPLKPIILPFSTGNEGVPTDKQTNQPTDKQINLSSDSLTNDLESKKNNLQKSGFSEAFDILNSLDNIKKEIRLKFKRLTDQEFSVFSALYILHEEKGFSDYKTLSAKFNLSESSIREYIGKLIKKDIPIEKIKINNKTIHLKISPNLMKIASLSTILKLREI